MNEVVMFGTLGDSLYRRRGWVLGVGVLFLAVSTLFGIRLLGLLKPGGYANPHAQSSQVSASLQRDFSLHQAPLIVLFTSRDGLTVDHPDYQNEVQTVLERLRPQPDVVRVLDWYHTRAPQLISYDRQ